MSVREVEDDAVKAGLSYKRGLIEKMRRRLERASMDASRINDDGLDDQGSEVFLDETRKREAMDMRKSLRHQPGYIDIRRRRVELTEKLDAMRDSGERPQLNIGNVFVQIQPAQYPVKKLETPKTDE